MKRCVAWAAVLAGLAVTAGGPAGAGAAMRRERPTFAPPGQAAHHFADRRYHLQHVRLELAFDLHRRRIEGTATNVLVPLQPGLDEVLLHAAGLQISHIRLTAGGVDRRGEELTFTVDPAAQTVKVRLPRPFGPDEEIALAIDYSAQPRAGLYFIGPDRDYPDRPWQAYSDGEPELNRYWYPSWDEPDERATTEILATVERPFQVISNGRLVGITEGTGGRRVFDWLIDQSHAMYLTSVVIGEFSQWATSWRAVPIEAYVPPRALPLAPAAFAHTADMMETFSQWTGVPYPYAKYSQVTVEGFMWGGMENISAATESLDALRDARAQGDASSDDLVSHELAHQWFGDYVTCRSWAHSWLSEGMATYFEALYKQHLSPPPGDDELAWKLDTYRQSYILEDRDEYRRPLVTDRYVAPVRMFDAHTYDKGALVMHMIRYQTGDAAWWNGIHRYLTHNALSTVVSQDLQRAMEDAAGIDLGALFEQFVYGAGYPEIQLRWDYDAGMVHLELRQTQEIDAQTGYFSFPVEVGLLAADGSLEIQRVKMQARALQDLYLSSPARPRTVVFDPHGALLKTLDFDKPSAEWVAQLNDSLPLASHLDALRGLAARADADALAALAKAALHHRFQGAREVAIAGLEQIASDEALVTLLQATADREPSVRALAYASLGAFPDRQELVARLGHALAEDPSYNVRSGAAAALGHFISYRTQAAPLLVAALQQPSYQDQVAGSAIEALASLGAPDAFSRAERLAHYGHPPNLRIAALLALAKAAVQEIKPGRKDEARKILQGYLDDPDFNVRLRVPEALADLGDPAAIPALERSLAAEIEDEQRQPREKAIRQLRATPATN